jgi:hypothetical protein
MQLGVQVCAGLPLQLCLAQPCSSSTRNHDSKVISHLRSAGHGMLCSASRSSSVPDASTLVALTTLHGWVAICTASVKGASVGAH